MVAAALAVSGCGGGGTAPTPPGGTTATQDLKTAADTALKEADAAVKAVMDGSEDATVSAADTKVAAAEAAVDKVPAAERGDLSQRLMDIKVMLATRKSGRTTAMKAKADMMKAVAVAVHAGIAPYSDADDSVDKRSASWGDAGIEIFADATVNIAIGEADAEQLKLDKAAMVEALGGWKGARYKLDKEGTTYEAVVYDNAYSAPGDTFSHAWRDDIEREGPFKGWLKTAAVSSANKITITDDSVDIVAGPNVFAGVDESVRLKGAINGVAGTFLCAPVKDRRCAANPVAGGLQLGGVTESLVFANSHANWRFKPDNGGDRLDSDPDPAFVTYGYWIRKGADGTWDVSAFHNANRGAIPTFAGIEDDANLVGKATYGGGAAGVYALSDGAGKFTADAELVADFTSNTVTGTIDGFMTEGLTGGDGMSRDWSVELHKLAVADGGGMGPDTSSGATGLTRWTMGGRPAPAAGKWEGAFYDRPSKGSRPRAATGSFYAEHNLDGPSRMVGAFGVQDPGRDEQ